MKVRKATTDSFVDDLPPRSPTKRPKRSLLDASHTPPLKFNIPQWVTLLQEAVQANDTQRFEALLSLFHNPSETTRLINSETTILHLACAVRGRSDMVRLLLQRHGANAHLPCEWDHDSLPTNHGRRPRVFPLHLAAHTSVETVRVLIDSGGADVNVQDDLGQTPLHRANVLVTETLLRCRANLEIQDMHGNTALHASVHNVAKVHVLLRQRRIPVNAQNHCGETALMVAVRKGLHTTVRCLLRHPSIQVDLADRNGITPLGQACLTGDKRLVEVVLCLAQQCQQQRMKKRQKKNRKNTKNAATVPPLAINTPDAFGRTPLHMAMCRPVEGNRVAIVRLLLELGANPNTGPILWKPLIALLHHRTMDPHRRYDVYQALVDHGANVQVQDGDGKTALQLAAERGALDIVRDLVHTKRY